MRKARESELKQLHTQKSKLIENIKNLNAESLLLQRQVKNFSEKLKTIEEKIEKFKNKKLIVSEHSLLRYLERVKGVNIEEIKKEILTDNVINLYTQLGSGKFPDGENKFIAVVTDNVIVTIEGNENIEQ